MSQLEKSANSKAKIVQSAIYLFSKKSFNEVSMRDIAREAEVSPALIYKYFEDQQHLYTEALHIEGQKLIDEMQKSTSLKQLVENYIIYMYQHDVLYQMMAYFMLEMKNKQRDVPIFEETTKMIYQLAAALKPYVKSDEKKEAQLLFSTLNGLLITYKNYPTYSDEKALKHILSLANHYLLRFKKE